MGDMFFALGFVEYKAGRDWARQWTWFKTLCKVTFQQSSRKELIELYPERAGAIINVKGFAHGGGAYCSMRRLARLAIRFLRPR